MSGAYARLGFRYQDWFLLREALVCLRRSLAGSWEQGSLDPYQEISRCPVKFGIEAATNHSGGQPTWDSLVLEDAQTRVIEVKSGNVTAEDRRALWRRVRKEVARSGLGKTTPVLVVDPSRCADCESFRGLAKGAKDCAGISLPASPPARVVSNASMLQEAFWYLCVEPEPQPGTCPPLAVADALDVLRRFKLLELESNQLESEVGLLLEVLFPQLMVETSARLLQGWLDERATAPDLADHQFSLIQLLEVVGRFDQCAALRPGQLAHWRALWRELRQQQMSRSSCRLGQTGATLQPAESQPTAVTQILQGSLAKNLLLGEGGAGKTTLLNQLACQTPEHLTLLAWADGVSEAELEQLGESIRFLCSLCALSAWTEVVNVFVDALEEAGAPKRENWARLFSRISGLLRIRILASMREADFRGDANVRTQLQDWSEVKVQVWPEEIVRSLLTSVGHSQVYPKLFELLQRPILLDLYWRTFVEGGTATQPHAGDVTTRHGLLRTFWLNRLLLSPRHQPMGDVAARCATVFEAAANTLGFQETGLDPAAIATLLSEGILVVQSGLQSRLRFRHPFLRDFATAQWCLAVGTAKEVYDRWHRIRSSICRTGALRAMLEALADDSVETDFPQFTIADLISTFLIHDAEFQNEVPRALGALAPNQRTNPALWPAGVQSQLSPSFASQLLTEARHHANTTWAEALENWPATASWLPEGFPVEVLNYVSFLATRLQQSPQIVELRRQTLAGSRALRNMSEECRFASFVLGNGRWLKAAIISLVTPLLPNNDTLLWLERETQQASHRTRECILEVLVFIAPVDFTRTANLYRSVVRLTETNGAFAIDSAVWEGMMAEHAVGWCLGSHGQKTGLLDRYPVQFLPLALEVAEALSIPYLSKKRESLRRIRTDIAKATGDTVTEIQEEPSPPPPALIDDRPNYTFWKTRYRTGPYERCLALIYDSIRRVEATTPDVFLHQVAPLLMASRLATVRSFLFDVCLTHVGEPGFASLLGQLLCDRRIYPLSCLAFWIQEGLARAWPSMSEDQRRSVLEHLNSFVSDADRGGAFRRLQYLATLPEEDLSADLHSEVEAHRAAGNSPFRRPEDFGGASFTAPSNPSDGAERLLGECTPACRNQFKQFYRQYHEYQPKQNEPEELVRRLPQLLQVAKEVAENFSRPENLLTPHGLLWLWSAFESLLASCLKPAKEEESFIRPPDTFVRRAAEAALVALDGILSQPVLEDRAEETDPPPAWEEALRLANVAMAFDCALADRNLISRFHAVLKQAAGSPHPGIQRSLLTDIHPWHWQLNSSLRGEIKKLLLEKAQHGEVLKWGLSALDSFPDQERTEILAKLLQRTDMTHSDEFIQFFGRYLGAWGMAMFRDGQRSGVALLVSTLLSDPAQFALIRNPEAHRDLLAGIAGGMEEQVRGSLRSDALIPDFAGWLGRITQKIRQLPRSRTGSAGILSIALHFLEQAERKDCPIAVAKPWWDALYPLLKETLQNGHVDEAWMILFDQRSGACSDLSSVDEVCRLVEIVLGRIDSGLAAGALDVNVRNFEQGPRNTWRECADLAAEWLLTLLDAGRVTREHERETVFRLFQRLSASPLNSEKALSGLHRMQGA